MKRRLFAVLMVVGLLLPAWAEPCWACSCIETTKKEQAKQADAVFTGRVVEIRNGQEGQLKVRFNVRKVYKGAVKESQVVRTANNEAACGIEFESGKRYTVFAEKSDGKYLTGLCSGTKRGRIDHKEYGLPPGEPPE